MSEPERGAEGGAPKAETQPEERPSFWLGIVLVAVSSVALILARGFAATRLGSNADPGAAAFPTLIAGALWIMGAWEAFQGWRQRKEGTKGTDWVHGAVSLAVFLGAFVGYAIGISILGFALATLVFGVLMMRWLGTKWWVAGVSTLVIVVTVEVLFVQLFRVQLPTGILGLPF